ncbi:hypothetical protein Scep_016497 [Stephania cephalantha]|uniref:Uncharacterized protein n=1 Tax=Stephania cephalantha TaxID=152367 RepID=A0AAP0NU82_9MAGN
MEDPHNFTFFLSFSTGLAICKAAIDQMCGCREESVHEIQLHHWGQLTERNKGKRLIDLEYGEKDLVKWVSTTLNQEEIDHIIDPNLGSYHKEEICKVINIGLLCTNLVPTNRPSMRNVVKMLLEAHVI